MTFKHANMIFLPKFVTHISFYKPCKYMKYVFVRKVTCTRSTQSKILADVFFQHPTQSDIDVLAP